MRMSPVIGKVMECKVRKCFSITYKIGRPVRLVQYSLPYVRLEGAGTLINILVSFSLSTPATSNFSLWQATGNIPLQV